jgi:hypothetical protein
VPVSLCPVIPQRHEPSESECDVEAISYEKSHYRQTVDPKHRREPAAHQIRLQMQTMEGDSVSTTQRSSTRQDADAIEQVREILWPHDDPQRQWTPDTLDRIAEVVRPDGPPVVNKPKRVSDVELRSLYGNNAVLSRKALFTLVHLDNPSPEVVCQRQREFDPATFFCEDCPLCGLMKESGVIVFDESVVDGEDV